MIRQTQFPHHVTQIFCHIRICWNWWPDELTDGYWTSDWGLLSFVYSNPKPSLFFIRVFGMWPVEFITKKIKFPQFVCIRSEIKGRNIWTPERTVVNRIDVLFKIVGPEILPIFGDPTDYVALPTVRKDQSRPDGCLCNRQLELFLSLQTLP